MVTRLNPGLPAVTDARMIASSIKPLQLLLFTIQRSSVSSWSAELCRKKKRIITAHTEWSKVVAAGTLRDEPGERCENHWSPDKWNNKKRVWENIKLQPAALGLHFQFRFWAWVKVLCVSHPWSPACQERELTGQTGSLYGHARLDWL